MLDATLQPASHAIVAWRRRHEKALGACVDADADTQPLVPTMGLGTSS
jgi:hypothetical protein